MTDLHRYHATVLLNLTSAFNDCLPDRDLFVSLAETTDFVVDASHVEVAAEAIFAIGNRQFNDLNGKGWSPKVRSMSAGDIVILHEGMGKGTYWACDRAGWRDVTDEVTDADFDWMKGTEAAYRMAHQFRASQAVFAEV